MAFQPAGPNDRGDIKLFVACLLVGLVGIVILKLLVDSQLVVTAFPCAVLGLYIWYVWKTKRYQLRGDRAGDSVYYLGFLYTLLSLGISLYQFTQAGMGARDIVGNLGIALFTTIMGLAGRVVLTQLREDPVEIEESARMALAQASAQVRSELMQMVEDFNVFRRTTVQSISEGTEQVSKSTNESLAGNVDAFTSSTRAAIARLEQVVADFGDSAQKLNAVSAGTVAVLENLLTKLEAIEAPESLISSKFDPLAVRIREVVEEFSRRATEQQDTATETLTETPAPVRPEAAE